MAKIEEYYKIALQALLSNPEVTTKLDVRLMETDRVTDGLTNAALFMAKAAVSKIEDLPVLDEYKEEEK